MTDFKASNIYRNFSARINQSNPELLLGPNWKDVLNFWLFLDTLSEEQYKTIYKRYCELDYSAQDAARLAAREAARDAAWAAWDIAGYATYHAAWDAAWEAAWDAAGYATYELIGSHILISQNKPLIFLPLFLDL